MLTKFKYETNVIENIKQIKIDVPYNVKFVCLYLFELNGKTILIDSGMNLQNWDQSFYSSLDQLGISVNEIDYCIITHIHTDHIGMIKKLKEKNGNLKILMHDVAYRILKWEKDEANQEQFKKEAQDAADLMVKYGISKEQGKLVYNFFTLWPRYIEYQEPDQIIHDGDIILDDLEVIWTPGHSFGHICIFNKANKYLFSGDHILSRISPHIGAYVMNPDLRREYEGSHFDNILAHYLNSLDKIDKLNPKIIFPAHQEIIYNPHERIQEIKAHHKNRLSEILETIKSKELTAYEISQEQFGKDLDQMNSYLALSEVLSHLIYLEQNGKVIKSEKDGIYYFKAI
jgi:glyoxylase-like metal-dependent hydrolase (beta-lactamase superfamily II)